MSKKEDEPLRPQIIIHRQVDLSLESAKKAVRAEERADRFSNGIKRRRNFASLLSDLWELTEDTMEQVRVCSDPLPKKAAMIRELARTLPLLDRAEQRHRTALKDRNIDDATDEEVEGEAKRILALRAKGPKRG